MNFYAVFKLKKKNLNEEEEEAKKNISSSSKSWSLSRKIFVASNKKLIKKVTSEFVARGCKYGAPVED